MAPKRKTTAPKRVTTAPKRVTTRQTTKRKRDAPSSSQQSTSTDDDATALNGNGINAMDAHADRAAPTAPHVPHCSPTQVILPQFPIPPQDPGPHFLGPSHIAPDVPIPAIALMGQGVGDCMTGAVNAMPVDFHVSMNVKNINYGLMNSFALPLCSSRPH